MEIRTFKAVLFPMIGISFHTMGIMLHLWRLDVYIGKKWRSK